MLEAGALLGPYEVVSPLGAGGVGEVYRARDTKLDRDVALKVLPEAFTSDPDRLARFEREAKVLASLNHPHIGHIVEPKLTEAANRNSVHTELLVRTPTRSEPTCVRPCGLGTAEPKIPSPTAHIPRARPCATLSESVELGLASRANPE